MAFFDRLSAFLKWLFTVRDLWTAAKFGSVTDIQRLIAQGAEVNARDSLYEGGTPLHLASEYGRLEAIRELVSRGANINARDYGRSTPLIAAASGKRPIETVRLLLELGADIDAVGSAGMSALSTAAFYGRLDLVRFLLEKGAKPNLKSGKRVVGPVNCTVHANSMEVLEVLLSAGAFVDAPGLGGSCALDTAAVFGKVKFVQRLLRAGANPNIRDAEDGRTPLHSAVSGGKPEIVQMLVEAGADVNAQDNQGETPLDRARSFRRKRLVLLLLKLGAKPGNKRPTEEETERERETPDLSQRAKTEEFKSVLSDLEQIVGKKAAQWRSVPGGRRFKIPESKAAEFALESQKRFLEKGAFIFRTDDGLGVVPSGDKYEVVLAVQTNGQNYDLMPEDIVDAFQTLETDEQFSFIGIGGAFLEGSFVLPLKDPRQVAEALIEVCPEIGEKGDELVDDLASQLAADGRFFLWWD